jgi:hypothetical protein
MSYVRHYRAPSFQWADYRAVPTREGQQSAASLPIDDWRRPVRKRAVKGWYVAVCARASVRQTGVTRPQIETVDLVVAAAVPTWTRTTTAKGAVLLRPMVKNRSYARSASEQRLSMRKQRGRPAQTLFGIRVTVVAAVLWLLQVARRSKVWVSA